MKDENKTKAELIKELKLLREELKKGAFKDITEHKQAEEELTELAKYPAENPYPVLRVSKDGTVLYHNCPSESLLEYWHYQEGKPLQDSLFQFVLGALCDDDIKTVETEIGDKVIFLTFAPIVEKDFVNVYGFDITERKQAEEAVKKSHQEFVSLFYSSPEALIYLDEKSNILNLNPRFTELFGYTLKEIKGRNIDEGFIHPSDKIEKGKKLSIKGLEGYLNYETIRKKKDGTLFPVSISVTPLVIDGKTKGEIGTYIDISERKQAEEKLAETKEYLENLIKYSNAPIIVWDTSLSITLFNRAFENLSGYQESEVMGKKIDILFSENNIESALEHIQKTVSGERWESVEIKIQRKDGEPRIVLWNTANILDKEKKNIIATIAQGQDITQRKQAEKSLRRERQRLHNVLEVMPMMVCLLTPDYHIPFANRAFREKFGKSKGRHCYEYCFGKKEPCDFCESYEVLKTGKPHRWEVTSLDGATVIDAYDFPFTDVDGSSMILEIDVDITERRQAQKALQEAHDQLEDQVAKRTEELQKANLKLQELDRLKTMFIASMSHELRSPLSLIIGFTDIILQEVSGEINQKQRRQFTLVKKNANHLLNLINNILDINKIEAGKMNILIEEFNLSALSREIRDNFKVVANKKGLALSLETPPTVLIENDRRRTKQILVNLMSNALKFTHRGEIKIKVIPKNETVEVYVRDTGVGIKKENMDKLFNSFSQIANQGRIEEGTGLGLYLSKKNAHLLSGDIMVESEFGKGSVFTLTLPLKYKETKG